jgi:hypothetical protein
MLESSVHTLWTRIDCSQDECRTSSPPNVQEEHGTIIDPCDEVEFKIGGGNGVILTAPRAYPGFLRALSRREFNFEILSPFAKYQALGYLFLIKAKFLELSGTHAYFSNRMCAAGTEAFPLLATTASEKPTALSGPNGIDKQQTRRRKSSGLGEEITAGDTGAPAFATLDVRPESPGAIKVSQVAAS